uniref:Uncharacterized protein n=1 Tax=Rhizophora mucronata TaxID=61149 RepID=A0A2P2NYH0_RHIMU
MQMQIGLGHPLIGLQQDIVFLFMEI